MTGYRLRTLLTGFLSIFIQSGLSVNLVSERTPQIDMDINSIIAESIPWQCPTGAEPGMEYGVSAAFAGRIGNTLIMAGGCNFPVPDPTSPKASKQFYKGIYAADIDTMIWRRIGSLPEASAYGATVAADGTGLVLIGGSSSSRSLKDVFFLSFSEQGEVQLRQLPSLAVTIDNASAAAIGSKVYVAGGNANGVPSKRLYMLDLAIVGASWERLCDMPGNMRVQPTMASGINGTGETCLYLFGGFAPRVGDKSPTLDTDGLVYVPSEDKWHTITGPSDVDGLDVSLGGGCAASLQDGKIIYAGGVNRDIFLEALANQAPDYLYHPMEWYRFNPYVFIFDPATLEWGRSRALPEAARAGASMVSGAGSDIFIIGGELKPRVRTSKTFHIK